MPFNFDGLYVPTECLSNNIEMAEDDNVLDNTKYMDLAEDNIEAAQCVIMTNIVISIEAGPDLRSFLKYKSHHIARTVSIYFYHLNMACNRTEFQS